MRMPRDLARMRMPALLVLFLVLGREASGQNALRQGPTEAEVKAAFLYHFAQLVTWPEPAEAAEPIVLAVIGPDAFAEKLEATIGGETVRGRPLKIARIAALADLPAPPHILFIASTDPDEVERVLAAAAKAPVLTVGNGGGFAGRGGMIEFRLTPARRVAFDINAQAAANAGLKMSSQLLKIARIVESRK
jgi:hypothetical protein